MFNFKFSAPLAATLALVLILIFAGLRYPGFLGSYNILTVLQYNSMFCLISIGMCFVIMTGGIDLSVGTVAALGLSSRHMPYKGLIMATLISPMIVPLIISGVAIFFFIAKIGLAATHLGIIIAHIILGTPFVVITVTATLSGFDHSVTRAAASLGSNPVNTFMKITLPLILPGVISGALFAFVTSFDEVVVVLFLAGLENTTIPIQMWTGLREQLSPTILAVATCLIVLSTLILVTAELLRRRSERIRGINR